MALVASLVKKVKAFFRRGGLDNETSVQLRNAVADTGSANAAELAGRLIRKEVSLVGFQAELYLMTRNAHIAQFALARGALTDIDRATLGKLIGTQAGYLRDFVAQIGKGELTAEQIRARAALYPESAIEAHSRGVAAARGVSPDVFPPAHPMCRCHLEYGDDGAWWWVTSEDGRVCPICLGLADQYAKPEAA